MITIRGTAARVKFRLSRSAAQAYASTHGFFWLPCPLCGSYFGGHEWQDGHAIPSGENTQGVCPICGDGLLRAAATMCAVYGHTFGGVWKATATSPGSLSIKLDRPPDLVRCMTCHTPAP